ncbi:MAG: flavodoxin family protein [Candidatus Firestonebacteria bacterium]
MKILGINGSPRIGGNTDILLDHALNGARSVGADVEKIILNNLNLKPCLECLDARKDGVCIVNDDLQMVYKKIDKAQGIILASPIFFGSLSAQTKIMIDRFQCLWMAKYVYKSVPIKKRKPGVFISVEGSKISKFFDNAKSIVQNFFVTIDVDYTEELFCLGVNKKGSVLKQTDFLKKAFNLGLKIAKTLDI